MKLSHSRSSKRTITLCVQALATSGRPPLLKFSAIECLIQRFHSHFQPVATQFGRWWTRLCSVHNLARLIWVTEMILCYVHVDISFYKKNEVWESESNWHSLHPFSCVRPHFWGWMSMEWCSKNQSSSNPRINVLFQCCNVAISYCR